MSDDLEIDLDAIQRRMDGAMLLELFTRDGVGTMIAATALVHGLTVVTRNEADFSATGAALLNPWNWTATV